MCTIITSVPEVSHMDMAAYCRYMGKSKDMSRGMGMSVEAEVAFTPVIPTHPALRRSSNSSSTLCSLGLCTPSVTRLSRRVYVYECEKNWHRYEVLRATLQRSDRETDARGFVLPQQGDIVIFPGRWPSEDEVGLVESIRFIPSKSAHVVDVHTLSRISTDLFAVPGALKRGKLRWFDVAEVRIVPDAEYIPGQDAYRVLGTRDGYAPVPKLKREEKERIDDEYRQLQRSMLRTAASVGVVGTLVVSAFGGGSFEVGRAYALGAGASVLYLILLQRAVDALGETPSFVSRLLALRFAVPLLPFLALSYVHLGNSFTASTMFASLSRPEALAIVIGLLTYKAPLLTRTAGEFVDGLADLELGKTGMIGTLAALTARQIRSRLQKQQQDDVMESNDVSMGDTRLVLIFAGPSGVGKSTLIHRLLEEFPGRFAYSVSHTTREPRKREEDGQDYSFVSKEAFEEMVQRDEFVEYAKIHGQSYGTSFKAVDQVLCSGRICILDLDVQGVEAVRKKKNLNWHARFIWIAPPSIQALERRLRKRGTETEQSLKTRLDTAKRELAYAATNNVFDIIVVNDDINSAYRELREFVERTNREWFDS